MEETVQQAQVVESSAGPSKPHVNVEDHDSNDYGTAIEISSAPTLGFHENTFEDVQHPIPDDDFMMVLDDEESSGSQYSTSKPKVKKKKKIAV